MLHRQAHRSWHLPGNPKRVWHPAGLLKEGGGVHLFMDTMYLKIPKFTFDLKALLLLSFFLLLSPRIIMPCHCSSTTIKDYFLVIFLSTKWPLCGSVPLNPHSLCHTWQAVGRLQLLRLLQLIQPEVYVDWGEPPSISAACEWVFSHSEGCFMVRIM